MTVVLENPLALLFLSFAIGAMLHGVFSNMGWYSRFYNLKFLGDQTTKRIGVLWIEWLILKTPLRLFNQQLKIKGRPTRSQLEKLRDVMNGAELSHIMGFIILLPINIWYIISGKSVLLIISLLILNILFNGYTALTQQYNKRRLDRLIERY